MLCYSEKAEYAKRHPGFRTTTNPAEDDSNKQCTWCVFLAIPGICYFFCVSTNSYTGTLAYLRDNSSISRTTIRAKIQVAIATG